jgi:hypothetical protein
MGARRHRGVETSPCRPIVKLGGAASTRSPQGAAPDRERSRPLSQDETAWRAGTEPYALTLDSEIRAAGSRTAIYETWGYASGQFSGDSFAAMQERLTRRNALLAMDCRRR